MNDMTICLSFLDRQNNFFQRGAVVLEFGKNFIFWSDIANSLNLLAADT